MSPVTETFIIDSDAEGQLSGFGQIGVALETEPYEVRVNVYSGIGGCDSYSDYSDPSLSVTPIDGTPALDGTVADQVYIEQSAITDLVLPAATGGNGELTYSLTPSPPAGLSIDTTTRTLSGAPSAAQAVMTYTWKVTDADGDTDEETFNITVVKPPAAPMISATAGDAQITLNWADPSDSTISNYQVRYAMGSDATTGTWAGITGSSATTTSHTVTGLANGTQYAFQIRAVNLAGEGDASNTVTATPESRELTLTGLGAGNTLALAEGSGDGTFTVALSVAPTANVTVSATSDDTGAATVTPASLTFTTANWNQAQTVTVSPVNDPDAADETVTVSLDASGAEYDAADQDVTVSVDDDEVAGLTVFPASLSLTEGGSGGTFSVSLAVPPTAEVTVAVASDDLGRCYGRARNTHLQCNNWNTAQAVNVSPVDDPDGADENLTVSLSASGASEYSTVTAQ